MRECFCFYGSDTKVKIGRAASRASERERERERESEEEGELAWYEEHSYKLGT